MGFAPDGKIWVATELGNFQLFDGAGTYLETWGQGGQGPGEFAFITQSANSMASGMLFLADASFYVVDACNARIQRFGPGRNFLGSWGAGDGVPSAPTAIALEPDGGLLVSFRQRPDLQRFSQQGAFLGALDLGLRNPTGMTVDKAGNIWVVDSNSEEGPDPEKPEIRVFDKDGKPILEFGKPNGGFDGLKKPNGAVLDNEGHLFIADSYHHRVVVFDLRGNFLLEIGGRGESAGKFNYVLGVGLDGQGGVYVGDWTGGRLEKFTVKGLPPSP